MTTTDARRTWRTECQWWRPGSILLGITLEAHADGIDVAFAYDTDAADSRPAIGLSIPWGDLVAVMPLESILDGLRAGDEK